MEIAKSTSLHHILKILNSLVIYIARYAVAMVTCAYLAKAFDAHKSPKYLMNESVASHA